MMSPDTTCSLLASGNATTTAITATSTSSASHTCGPTPDPSKSISISPKVDTASGLAPTTSEKDAVIATAAAPNLWEEAQVGLSDELQSELAIVSATVNGDLPLSVLYSIESFQRAHKDSKYRRIFEKITRAVEKFMVIGDFISSYDPAHAALPWAAVRFIFQLSINSSSTFEVIADGLDTISLLLVQDNIFEKLYLEAKLQVSNELHKALVNIYRSILIFVAKAHRFCAQSKVSRIAQSIRVSRNEFNEALENVRTK